MIKKKQVKDSIVFANAMIKTRYDQTYTCIKLKIEFIMYLKLHQEYTIFEINDKLAQQWVNSFKIIQKIESLIYKLNLSLLMKIHSRIFIVQLKSVNQENLYNWTFNLKFLLIKNQ